MSKNRVLVSKAKAGLNKFKMEAAREVGVNLKDGYFKREWFCRRTNG